MALLETRLKHKSYFIELCGSGPWKQNLKFHKWLCLSRLRQKKIIELWFFFWPRQTMHQKRWRGSQRARQHCLEGIAEKKVRNCVKTLEITASFFKVCNLTQQLSPPKSSARGHSQNNSNKFTFSHFLFCYVESTRFFSCKLEVLNFDRKRRYIKKIINPPQLA